MPPLKRVLIFLFSFLMAWMFMIFPLPLKLEYLRPEILMLVLIYWVYKQPQYVGVLTAWTVGFVMDILGGVLLGQYALSLALVAYITQRLSTRLRIYPFWQQTFLILVLVGLGQFAMMIIQWLIGRPPLLLFYFASTVTTLLLWPWVFRIMQYYERRVFN